MKKGRWTNKLHVQGAVGMVFEMICAPTGKQHNYAEGMSYM